MRYGKTLTAIITIIVFGSVFFLFFQALFIDLIDDLLIPDLETGRIEGVTAINLIMWYNTLALLTAFSLSTIFIMDSRYSLISVSLTIIGTISSIFLISVIGMTLRPDLDLQLFVVVGSYIAFILKDPNVFFIMVVIIYSVFIGILNIFVEIE